MSKSVQTTIVLTIGIVLVVILTTGCEEQSLTSTRKSRLIADENKQLTEQLAQRNREIEKQKKLLEQCLKGKKVLTEQLKEKMGEMIRNALNNRDKETERLQEENKKLKAQIEELKKQLKAEE